METPEASAEDEVETEQEQRKLLMKLITEEIESIEILHEESGKEYFIKGIFLQTEMITVMVAVQAQHRSEIDKYTESFINCGRALGELGHLEGPTINLDRVSIRSLNLYQKVQTSSAKPF